MKTIKATKRKTVAKPSKAKANNIAVTVPAQPPTTIPPSVNTLKEHPAAQLPAAISTPPAAPPAPNPNAIQVVDDGRPRAEQLADSVLSTIALNAVTAVNAVPAMAKEEVAKIGLAAFIKIMGNRVAAVAAGVLSGIEATMTAQVVSMDATYAGLMLKAQTNFSGGYLDAGERYMRLAFKAQSQCRATAETLGELKNPRPVFAKQFNLANGNQQINQADGPQQVNNGTVPLSSRAPEKPLITNKLLKA